MQLQDETTRLVKHFKSLAPQGNCGQVEFEEQVWPFGMEQGRIERYVSVNCFLIFQVFL